MGGLNSRHVIGVTDCGNARVQQAFGVHGVNGRARAVGHNSSSSRWSLGLQRIDVGRWADQAPNTRACAVRFRGFKRTGNAQLAVTFGDWWRFRGHGFILSLKKVWCEVRDRDRASIAL